jgi:hypothetical protein
MPWSMLPEPPEKAAVSVALPPGATVAGAAVKLVITGAGTTVTVAAAVAVPPLPVAVRV